MLCFVHQWAGHGPLLQKLVIFHLLCSRLKWIVLTEDFFCASCLFCIALNPLNQDRRTFSHRYGIQNVASVSDVWLCGERGTIWILTWELHLMSLTCKIQTAWFITAKTIHIHFSIPWERVGKYLCFAGDTSLPCDSICSSQSSQAGGEGGVLRGQAEWLKAENWVGEIPLQAGMCQTGTASDRACSYVSSSPSNGAPWNFVGSLAKTLYGVLKENGNCWSVINNFFFFVCVCESCFGKKIFQNMVCTDYMYKRLIMHLVCATQGDQRESPCLSVLPPKSLGLV